MLQSFSGDRCPEPFHFHEFLSRPGSSGRGSHWLSKGIPEGVSSIAKCVIAVRRLWEKFVDQLADNVKIYTFERITR